MATVPSVQTIQAALDQAVTGINVREGLVETAISILVLTLLFALIYFVFARQFPESKKRQRFKARLFYCLISLAIVVIAKVWVNGFTHIVAVFSLFSAAIVVTNKELVMNFVGGLIISWRGLFTEKDHIQLQHYSGTVVGLGVLYFKLLETSTNAVNRSSGKMIKIPNGLVINNAVINFSQQSNFIEYSQRWLTSIGSDVDLMKKLLIETAESILNPYYHQEREESIDSLKERNAPLSALINFRPNVTIDLKWEKPTGILFNLSYYCYPRDRDRLDWALKQKMLHALRQQTTIQVVDTT